MPINKNLFFDYYFFSHQIESYHLIVIGMKAMGLLPLRSCRLGNSNMCSYYF